MRDDTMIGIRVTHEMKEALEEAAKENDRSVAHEVRRMLRRALEATGRNVAPY